MFDLRVWSDFCWKHDAFAASHRLSKWFFRHHSNHTYTHIDDRIKSKQIQYSYVEWRSITYFMFTANGTSILKKRLPDCWAHRALASLGALHWPRLILTEVNGMIDLSWNFINAYSIEINMSFHVWNRCSLPVGRLPSNQIHIYCCNNKVFFFELSNEIVPYVGGAVFTTCTLWTDEHIKCFQLNFTRSSVDSDKIWDLVSG